MTRPTASLGAYDPQEVEVFGLTFTTRDLDRASARKARVLQEELVDSDLIEDPDEAEKAEDENVKIIGKILDLKLEPPEMAGGKPGKKASAVVLEHWKSNKLGKDRLLLFFGEVMAIEVRPR
jgi:hypothetical protein